MVPELLAVPTLVSFLLVRARAGAGDERGMTTETVVITALLVVLAISAVGIIANKVLNKANSIDVGAPAALYVESD